MIESRWLLFLLAWALAAAIQTALYLRQRRTRDATAVDAGWAASLVAIAALYALLADGSLAHRVLIATMAGLENLRVARLVLPRVGKGEDERYRELREPLAGARSRAVQLLRLLPGTGSRGGGPLGADPAGGVRPGRAAGATRLGGAALWIGAAVLERTADRQLQRFKSDPTNKGRTLKTGLWRYSRHPNYFFQWLTWVAYALVALEAPYGWIAD